MKFKKITFVILCALGFGSFSTSAEPLRFSSSVLAPRLKPDGTGSLNGILDELFTRAGIEFVYEIMPPDRARHEALKGRVDGELSRVHFFYDGVDSMVRVDEPLYYVRIAAYSLKDTPSISTRKDLQQYSVGQVRGWAIATKLLEGHNDVQEMTSIDALFRMVQKGRIDFALIATIPGQIMINKEEFNQITQSGYFVDVPFHMFLNKKYEAEARLLATILKDLRSEGKLDILTVENPN